MEALDQCMFECFALFCWNSFSNLMLRLIFFVMGFQTTPRDKLWTVSIAEFVLKAVERHQGMNYMLLINGKVEHSQHQLSCC